MQQVQLYTNAALQLIHRLEQQPKGINLPARFCFPTIPITLATHHAAGGPNGQQVTPYSPSHLNVTRATTNTGANQSTADRSNKRQSTPRKGTPSTTRTLKDIQCLTCATYGHEVQDCRFLPKLASGLEYYIKTHATNVQQILQRGFRQQHHPANIPSAQKVIAQAVYDQFGEDHDDEFELNKFIARLTTSMLGTCDTTDDQDAYDNENNGMINSLQANSYDHPLDHCTAIQPVQFPLLQQVHDDMRKYPRYREMARADEEARTERIQTETTVEPQHECITISMTTIQQRDLLVDTGASVSATVMKEILHQFTT